MPDHNVTHGNSIRFIVDKKGVDSSEYPEDSIVFDTVNNKIHIGGQEFISQQAINGSTSESSSTTEKKWLVLANEIDVDSRFDSTHDLDPTRFDVVILDWYEELKSYLLEGGEYYTNEPALCNHIVTNYLKDKNPQNYSRVIVLFGDQGEEIEPISGDTRTASAVVSCFESLLRVWNTPGNNSCSTSYDERRTMAYMPTFKMFFRSAMPSTAKRIILKLMQNGVVWLGMHAGAVPYATYQGFGDRYHLGFSYDDNLLNYLWENDCTLHSYMKYWGGGSSTEPILKSESYSSLSEIPQWNSGSYYVRIDIVDNEPTMKLMSEAHLKIQNLTYSQYQGFNTIVSCYFMPYTNFDGYLLNPFLKFKFNSKIEIRTGHSTYIYLGTLRECASTTTSFDWMQLPTFNISIDTEYHTEPTFLYPTIRVDAESIASYALEG